MRTWFIEGRELRREETPSQELAATSVRIRVHAVSLNYRDLVMKDSPREHPLIPCSDGAGEVVEVGASVTRFKPGDRVAGIFFQNWIDGPVRAEVHTQALGGSIDGMLREEVVLDETGVVAVPPHLSFEEAATLPCAGVTAWNALQESGALQVGQSLLLLGTGGVSIFGLQLGKAIGAEIWITSGSDTKLERAKEMGAIQAVNYRADESWDKTIWAKTEKKGIDHVLEVGGAGTLDRSLKVATYGGTVSLIGVLTGFEGRIDPHPILWKSLRAQGVYVGSRAMFERLNAFLQAHDIHPVIDRVFEFEDAPSAYEHLKSGSHFGKVVIRV